MTYEKIIEALHAHDLTSTATALDYAVREEACALMDNGPGGAYTTALHRKLRIPNERATKAAQQYYAEDIAAELTKPRGFAPSPATLLSHRRYAVAWAVAEVLHSNGVKL